MTPTLLHAISRKADAMTPDAELLARYLREREAGAFEELVRRHGPLVWSVCRQALPDRADAEDAFQAVFLALVRSADRIRDGRTLPAWLHGVAVRVTMRARREFARRRARERAAASTEADRPVSDAAWESLVAAVHEEVQRLPEAERTAFVLCELQGVSQPDAAARLGWPLGSLSGRLCKARQRLLDLLAARGIAPAAAVGVGITAGTACAVPEGVFEVVKSFPGAPGAASTAASALARGLVEGVAMRAKLTAAAVMFAALGLTGGAVWLSKADAQPGAGGPPPGAAGNNAKPQKPAGAAPGNPFGQPGAPGAQPKGAPGAGLPGAGDFAPGAGRSGMAAGWSVGHAAWEYKFVDVKPDRQEFEKAITQQGKDGWEFCGSERFGKFEWNSGTGVTATGPLVLVFKRTKGGGAGGMGVGMPGMSGLMGMGSMPGMPGLGGGGGGGGGGARAGAAGGSMGGAGAGGPWGNWGGKDGIEVRSFTLHNADAKDVAAALSKALPSGIKAAVPEPQTNRLLVVADAPAMKDVGKLVAEFDAKAAKPGAGGPMGSGSGTSGDPKPGGYPGMMPPGMAGPMSGYFAPGGKRPDGEYNVFNLKNANAADMEVLVKKLFPNTDMAADLRTNALIVRADEETLKKLGMLLTRLDSDPGKGK